METGTGWAGAQYLKNLQNLISGDIEMLDPIFDPHPTTEGIFESENLCLSFPRRKGRNFWVKCIGGNECRLCAITLQIGMFPDFAKDGSNAILFDHRTSNRVEELTQTLFSTLANEEKLPSLSKAALMTA